MPSRFGELKRAQQSETVATPSRFAELKQAEAEQPEPINPLSFKALSQAHLVERERAEERAKAALLARFTAPKYNRFGAVAGAAKRATDEDEALATRRQAEAWRKRREDDPASPGRARKAEDAPVSRFKRVAAEREEVLKPAAKPAEPKGSSHFRSVRAGLEQLTKAPSEQQLRLREVARSRRASDFAKAGANRSRDPHEDLVRKLVEDMPELAPMMDLMLQQEPDLTLFQLPPLPELGTGQLSEQRSASPRSDEASTAATTSPSLSAVTSPSVSVTLPQGLMPPQSPRCGTEGSALCTSPYAAEPAPAVFAG